MRVRVGFLFQALLLGACSSGGGGAPPGPPPAAANDVVAMVEGQALLLDVLANDGFDPAQVAVALASPPGRGTATVLQDQTVRYEPDPGFNGTDSFAYTVDLGTEVQEATVFVGVFSAAPADAPLVTLPRASILPREVAVLVNDQDAQSVAVAAYYAERRRIPDANIVHLSFAPGGTTMTSATFAPLHDQVEASAGPDIQAYVITWTTPYRVEGMSITSAFALGFDEAFYNASGQGCAATAPVDYYGSESLAPFTDHGIRPTMMLAGVSEADVRALIDRGVAADHTFPECTGYFVRTTDVARSVRFPAMEDARDLWDHLPDGLAFTYIDNSDGSGSNVVRDQVDVLFYLTGLASVPGIDTNTYRPGAVADHLTSFGGRLTGTGQMSIVRWLEAGATASFGTVIEPCNFLQKFPDPVLLVSAYYRGQTVLEAYWKSVHWPGEGIFVGEPLARPWGRSFVSFDQGTLTIRTTMLLPGRAYKIEAADDPAGPFETVQSAITVPHHQLATLVLTEATRAVYRLAAE